MNIKWNADKYACGFSFVHQYGNAVAGLIDRAGVKSILDLGCGTGELTKVFYDEGLAVTGIDASEEMLEAARDKYPYITFRRADAADFSLEEPVDAVFSNAVFHWIRKERQADVLRCVYNALRPQGQFVFEMGGQGNNRLIHQALRETFAEYGLAYAVPFYFPGIGEHTALLDRAGFKTTFAALIDRPTELVGENGLADWIEMFVKVPFKGMPPEDKDKITGSAVRKLRPVLYKNGRWYADYVRLRVRAIKL